MKIYFFSVLLLALSISCKNTHNSVKPEKSNNTPTTNSQHSQSYNESKEQWENLKKENSNSYKYTVRFSSFTGYSTTTKISIRNGKPVGREFTVFNPQEINTNGIQYTEDESNINTHKEGAVAKTIDELYQECVPLLNVDESTHHISFETDENGLIAICGNSHKQCADDCFKGIKISDFMWASNNQKITLVLPVYLQVYL